MIRTIQLDQLARTALASIEWDGAIARLTCGQLERKLYEQVNKVLEELGGKWNKKLRGHLFADDTTAEALDSVIESGQYVRGGSEKQVYQDFPTPPDIDSFEECRCAIHEHTHKSERMWHRWCFVKANTREKTA